MGFLDDLAKNAALLSAVEASKDKNGKPDPYKAAGMAIGMGNGSFGDIARLGAMLGSQGAFDTNTGDGCSYGVGYADTDSDWKSFCEDGSEYGVDPDDYDSEEEYEEALTEAKYGWREECEKDSEYGIEPEDYETEEEYEEALSEVEKCAEKTGITLNFSVNRPALDKLNAIKREDYPNQRRYDAAYTLANDFRTYVNVDDKQIEDARCRFILERADNILAANYLSNEDGFLYAQAVKDHFELPCSLPEEDAAREMEFSEIMIKIARYDITLSFEIWAWCLQQFLPYIQYDDYAGDALSMDVIDNLYSFPSEYKTQLIYYMEENREFHQNFMAAGHGFSNDISELVVTAIQEKRYTIAENLFKMGLGMAKNQWKEINCLTRGVIIGCKNYEEYDSMKCFRDVLLPFVKEIDIGMVQDEISEWEKEIDEYIDRVEDNCKYEKRKAKTEEIRKRRREERLQRQSNTQGQMPEQMEDMAIYIYCGVLLPFSNRPYSFRTEDESVQIGDTVIVPVGKENESMEGKVVSVGKYMRSGVPFPVEKTKFILEKKVPKVD